MTCVMHKAMSAKKNLVGLRFGMITVLSQSNDRMNGYVCWMCRCDCGKKVVMRSQSLRHGKTKSCGCVRTKHGDTLDGIYSKEYQAWLNMIGRCTNKNRPDYNRYGGRGISVCDRWFNYQNFLADMRRSPSSEHSLDRIDNNGNYDPDNCRWATKTQQANNRRSNHKITLGDKTLTVTEWARLHGVSPRLINVRLMRGWSEKDAIMAPKADRGQD